MDKYKCTNCSKTTNKPLTKGNGWIEFILWLCYIIPGLLYSIWRRSGEASICPSCKKETLVPNSIATVQPVRDEVTCEYCSELILATAKVCKHCGKDVIPQQSSVSTNNHNYSSSKTQSAFIQKLEEKMIQNQGKCVKDKNHIIFKDGKCVTCEVNKLKTFVICCFVIFMFLFLLAKCDSDEETSVNVTPPPVSVEVVKPQLTASQKTEKTNKILADLKTISSSEYAKNKDLYQQLVSLNPDNQTYKSKLEDYTKKLKYQLDNPYTEKDFDFDSKSSPYKKFIIAGVNKIHRENPKCKKLSTYSADLSGSRGNQTNPVFFVTCEYQGRYLNVWFNKKGKVIDED